MPQPHLYLYKESVLMLSTLFHSPNSQRNNDILCLYVSVLTDARVAFLVGGRTS